MHATDIVGYTYRAETLCPEDMHKVALGWQDTTPAAADMAVEPLLDQVAAYRLIDRQDEHTFDSDDFPKVVFASQVEDDERCDHCDESLVESWTGLR